MKTRTKLIFAILGWMAIGAGTPAQTEDLTVDPSGPVRRIVLIGEDGGTFYTVDCNNRTRGSVAVQENPPQVCATPQFGERMCQPVWRIVEAAKHVCQ